MVSPPPRVSMRKAVVKSIQKGVKQIQQHLQPSSPNDASSAVPPVDTRFTPPSQSSNPNLVTTLGLSNVTQNPPSQALSPPIPDIFLESLISSNASAHGAQTEAQSSATGKLWGATSRGLESALRALHISAGSIPPLKPVIGEFVSCLDIIQAATKNAEEYNELTSKLAVVAGILKGYLSELGLGDISSDPACEYIARSIGAEVAHIKKQQDRSKGKRALESTDDKGDVIKRYHRIEGLFQQLQADISLRTLKNTNEQHATTLLRGMLPIDDARYNSSYSTTIKRRGCTAETRQKVQKDLQDWMRDPNSAIVYWMNGMAGTGKTTIAYSLCEWLEGNRLLGASFFCSRSSSLCRNVSSIIPTIAYQLARQHSIFRAALLEVLKNDPDVGKLNVVRQFERLIREPMMTNENTIPGGVVVVIDALDECEDEYGVRLVLATLLKLCTNLPLKFFVTSRPEPVVRDNMLSPAGYLPDVLHLHDIEESIVKDDIKKYLTEALESLQQPPSHEQIDLLANHAGRLFIYAATAVRYILSGRGNPTARLNAMLNLDSHSTEAERYNKKYKELDELYTAILVAAFDEKELEQVEIDAMRLVLWTVVCSKEPMAIPTLASLIDLTQEQTSLVLGPLESVLHMSRKSGLVSTLHASFPDFMLNPSRSSNFYCNLTRHSEFLTHRCFSVMKEQLRFNICNLASSSIFDQHVLDLEQRIETNISPILFYACRYWGEHLRLAGTSFALRDELGDLLPQRLLFWMEVLNLQRCVVKGVSLLRFAESWLSFEKEDETLQEHAADARDFVTRFAAGACNLSTPHIYISMLPFCAKTSFVYAQYRLRTRGLMDVQGTAMGNRAQAAQATWLLEAVAFSVAFSPDGTRIITGSRDGTIQVWDTYTGNPIIGPLKRHQAPVRSVAFSPDGTRVISGSSDRSLWVWDARNGATVAGPLLGHTRKVMSAAFSPDNTRAVSGSADGNIRLWDAQTGDAVVGPFQGHIDRVNSVAFSPDCSCVVSGSSDGFIRLWSAHTGHTIVGPLGGQMGAVLSTAFSPDGTRIVSGAGDCSVRVWNSRTGDSIAGPFEGHADWVKSVAFTADGMRIVSGSGDGTIRVWEARTGDTVVGPFQGHTDRVNSIALSPDGTRVVSCSYDQTIRLWETRTNFTNTEPSHGHKKQICSVAFSPNGRRIASSELDGTIRVWDSHTGNIVAGPFQGHIDWAISVAFSPNGTKVVSHSYKSIEVWDVLSGTTVAGPFDVHTGAISIMSVTFSPDGAHIISILTDGSIRAWDIRGAQGSYRGGNKEGRGGGPDYEVHFGDTIVGPSEGQRSLSLAMVFSPGGIRVVSHFNNSGIQVWDARTGDTVAKLSGGNTNDVDWAAFSPDGAQIIAGSNHGCTIQVWDARSGDAIGGPFLGPIGWVRSGVFSPNGTRVASNSNNGGIWVWDVHTSDTVARPFEEHRGAALSVSFSPDGTRIACGSSDQTIRVSSLCADNAITLPNHQRTELLDRLMAILLNHPPPTHALDITPSGQVNIGDHLTDVVTSFKCYADGWTATGRTPLFWAPPDLRAHLPQPHNTLVIGPQGSMFIDYRNILLGERWHECYISE